MEKRQLIEYLSIVSRIEGEIFALKESKKEYESEISSLCVPIIIEKPKKNANYEQEIRNEVNKIAKPCDQNNASKAEAVMTCIGGIIFTMTFFTCTGAICGSYPNCSEWKSCDEYAGASFLLFLIFCVVAPIVYIIARLRDRNANLKAAAEYSVKVSSVRKAVDEKYDTIYKSKMSDYHYALKLEKERMDQEKSIVEHLKQFALVPTERRIQLLEKELEVLYALDILKPPFRNLAAVSQIYDYIQYDMCPQLEGPNGAYLQYQHDIRTNQIVSSISELQSVLSEKLDAVITAQYTMCSILNNTNSILRSIRSSVGHISSQLASVHRSIESLEQSQIEANQYIQQTHSQLQRIADAYNRTAIETESIGANQRTQMLEQGISEYRIKYPV